jgi:hypothetical protein
MEEIRKVVDVIVMSDVAGSEASAEAGGDANWTVSRAKLPPPVELDDQPLPVTKTD